MYRKVYGMRVLHRLRPDLHHEGNSMPTPKSVQSLYAGLKIGELTLLRRVRPNPKESPIKRKKWRCRCSCGNELTIPQYYLVRQPSPKTHCGCQNKTEKTIYNREYRIWLMIQVRCTDPRHVAYNNYGGRGIKVHKDFAKNNPQGFLNFLKHVGPSPTLKHTIDRIDNDKGYEPGNLKWSTPKEQRANQRVKQ